MWEKCHPLNSTAGGYAQQLTNTLLRFFSPGENPTMEKGCYGFKRDLQR